MGGQNKRKKDSKIRGKIKEDNKDKKIRMCKSGLLSIFLCLGVISGIIFYSQARAKTVNTSVIITVCGNTVVETGEECDDGNSNNTDSCLNNCTDAACGDGYVRGGVEQC